MTRKIRFEKPVQYSPSRTIPGQSLIPAELLKRHLAGTLPDIAKVPLYTYDEKGSQISEDLSGLELHELHDLSVRLRAEYDERAKQLKSQAAKEYDAKIIHDYLQTAASKQPPVGTAPVSGSETEL